VQPAPLGIGAPRTPGNSPTPVAAGLVCIAETAALLPGRDVTVASDVIAIDVQAVLGAIPGGGMDGMG